MTFVFDLETDLIDRGRKAPRPVCISFAGEEYPPSVVPIAVPGIDSWLFHPNRKFANHNIAFDMACLAAYWPHLIPTIFRAYQEGRVECTLIRQKLLDLRDIGSLDGGYSLEAVAARYGLKVEKDGGWRLGYSALRGIPVEQWPAGAVEYARRDAEVTLQVYQKQAEQDCPHSGAEAYADFCLFLASCHGVFTSRERTEAYLKVVEGEVERTKRYLQRAGLVRPDGSRDTKKAKVYMERLCNRRRMTIKRTDTGQVSLDNDACILSGSRLLEEYSKFVSASGTLNKVIDLTYGYDLPLQTEYNVIVETLRTSSRKPQLPLRGWQAQNPPNPSKKKRKGIDVRVGFRECLEPDGVYIIADYPSAELYSVAEVCYTQLGYSVLRDMLLADVDLHCMLASMILGVTYEEVLAGKKGQYEKARARAKIGNYTLWGGGGAESFILSSRAQYGELFTEDEFHAMRNAWRKMLPETRDYTGMVNRILAGRRYADVTHPLTGFKVAKRGYTALCNFFFQHLTATAMKDAYCEASRRCYADPKSALYGYRIPLEVHDEFVAEGRERGAHEAAIELAQVMTERYNKYVPNTPLKVEACVSRFWSKDAEPVYGPDGRMIPWEGKEKGK